MVNPLSSHELDTLTKSVNHSRYNINHPTRLGVNIIPHSGLYSGEFAHLRERWIDWPADDEDPILITIPEKDECPSIRFDKNEIVDRDEPCRVCRDQRDGHWEPANEHRVRQIPVQDERAKQCLKSWFSRYNTIPASTSITNNIRAAAEASPLDRTVTALDLRLTYANQLAVMEFDREFIADVCGYSPAPDAHSDTELFEILREHGYTRHQARDSDEILAELRTDSPLTNRELADRLNWPNPTLRAHTKRLRQAGKITRVNDQSPYQWALTDDERHP